MQKIEDLEKIYEKAILKIKDEYISFNLKKSRFSQNLIFIDHVFAVHIKNITKTKSEEEFSINFEKETYKKKIIKEITSFIESLNDNIFKIYKITNEIYFINNNNIIFNIDRIYNKKIAIKVNKEIKYNDDNLKERNFNENLMVNKEIVSEKIKEYIFNEIFLTNNELKDFIYNRVRKIYDLNKTLSINVKYDKKSKDKLKECFNMLNFDINEDLVSELTKVNEFMALQIDTIPFDVKMIAEIINNSKKKIKL